MNGAVSNLSLFPEAVATLGKELRHGGYDVVHVHEPNAPVASWYAAEAARAPTVATFHTYSTSWLAGRFTANVFGARRLYSKLSARIAVSEAAEWTARRYYGGRYRIVPNGVDLSAARPSARAPARRLEILFVGRAEERKGLPVLLRAFEALRGAGVDARLTVAGATEEEVAPLLLDTEGVEIAGRVSEEEKWRLLGEADLLCAPSLGGESFGMVLTEAFASGTPVVASRHRRLPRRRARTRQDGLLVPVGDAVELGEALRDLALDPERRAAHGRSRARARRALRVAAGRQRGRPRSTRRRSRSRSPRRRTARLPRASACSPAEPGPRVPPRRLPSLEPTRAPAARRRSARALARRVRRRRRRRGRRRAGRAGAAPHRARVDRRARCSPPRRSGCWSRSR